MGRQYFSMDCLMVLAILLSLPSSAIGKRKKGRQSGSGTRKLTDFTLPEAISLWKESPEAAERDYGPIGAWDTSEVTNFDELFQAERSFNEDISQWSTSKVTSMKNTFSLCEKFNLPLQDWDVSKVTSISGIFNGASKFNQPLEGWDTSNIQDMTSAFQSATSFNSRLDGWDTTKVTSMEMMWYGAIFFEDIHNALASWDVSSVTSMKSMFASATRFNGNLSLWKPKSVESFSGMFSYAPSFNPLTLDGWDVSSAKLMDRMFYRATDFQAELCWDTMPADVKGDEMFCGSDGTFDPQCDKNEPERSEECPEAYMEMEEDYEVDRESHNADQDTVDVVAEKPIRGGSGGVGAMNPGAGGRDHPEVTANLADAYHSNDGLSIMEPEVEDRTDEPPNMEIQPPDSEKIFHIEPIVNGQPTDAGPEVAVQQSLEAISSSRQRDKALPIAMLAITSLISFLI